MLPTLRPSYLAQLCSRQSGLLKACQTKSVSATTATTTTTTFAPARFHSAERRLIRDSSYPFPLYYHLLPSSSSSSASAASHILSPPAPKTSDLHSCYALAFLPTFPKHNRQIIGFVSHNPATTDLQVKPNKFTENEAFNAVLHASIQEHLSKDPMVQSVLQQQLEGWTHIADYRNPAPYGRIPLPEDIFGSVQIEDGVIKPSTYQRMPSHRIVSSHGLFQLSEYLHEKLVQRLQNL
ncbi:hypothetical protein EC968_002969 [Mortierella alpina]|nr:hypothetical protein EC968_002969 [Mortierella alpina]